MNPTTTLSHSPSGIGEMLDCVDHRALLKHPMTSFCLFVSSLIVSASVTQMQSETLPEGQFSMLCSNIAIVMISWIPILSHFSKNNVRSTSEVACPTCSSGRVQTNAHGSITERVGLDDPRLPLDLIACVRDLSGQYFDIERVIVVERITSLDGRVSYLLTLRYTPQSYMDDGGMLEFVHSKMGYTKPPTTPFTPTVVEEPSSSGTVPFFCTSGQSFY